MRINKSILLSTLGAFAALSVYAQDIEASLLLKQPGNEKNVLNGGDNMKSVEVKKSGTYRMEFDYSLLRSRIIFVK